MGELISAGLEVVNAPSELREAWTLLLSFGIGGNGITSDFDPAPSSGTKPQRFESIRGRHHNGAGPGCFYASPEYWTMGGS